MSHDADAIVGQLRRIADALEKMLPLLEKIANPPLEVKAKPLIRKWVDP